jgi:3-hydroxyacyl-[acyl-carrier-protein] dehydratase
MAFQFIDAVAEVEPGRRLVALKCVSLGEDYLRDHFPKFPVLPGVLMLECMFQASAWLLRVTEDFSKSTAVLSEAQAVRFRGLVRPGQTLQVAVDWEQVATEGTRFKTRGSILGQSEPVVTATLLVRSFNLADQDPSREALDECIRQHLRREWELIAPKI